MKHLRKIGAGLIACMLILQTIFVSGAATTANSSAIDAASLPIRYQLYDYFADVESARISGGEITSASPWRVEVQPAGGVWESVGTTFSRDADWTYLFGGVKNWGSYPGVSFYYPSNISGRYMINLITPTYSANSTEYTNNMAYSFTAPSNGSYNFGKCDQNKTVAFDTTNYFGQYSKDELLDFGVRITKNNQIIWNGASGAEKRDGYAVFGNKNAQRDKIEVPEISGIVMNEGDILRVEFTVFTPCDSNPWAQRVTGTPEMELSSLSTTPTNFPVFYDVYDFFDDVESCRLSNSEVFSTSPWSVQTKVLGGSWVSAGSSFARDNGYTYVYNGEHAWGNYPGYCYYAPETMPSNGRYHLARITPTNSAWGGDDDGWSINAAYTFTVPYDGVYTLGRSDQDLAIAWDEVNYFSQYDTSTQLDFGVRITKNDQVLWNGDSSAEKRDGFAVFGTKNAQNLKVAVPSLENLNLKFGDVIRVEFTNFTPVQDVWTQRINGLVSMTYNGPVGSQEAEPVSWMNTEIFDDPSLSLPLSATQSFSNNDFEAANKSISLTVLEAEANSPVEVWLGGYVLRIAGGASYLYRSYNGQEDFRYFILPSPQNGKYDITMSQQGLCTLIAGTEELSDHVVGTRVIVSVNGTSFTEDFSLSTMSDGLVVYNPGSKTVRVTGGAVSFQENAPCSIDRVTNVVYAAPGLSNSRIRFYMSDNKNISMPAANATGGAIVKGDSAESYTLAIGGDVNQDGKINIVDLIRSKKGLANIVQLSDAQKYAATFGHGYEINAEALTAFRRNIIITENLPESPRPSYKLYSGASDADLSANLLTDLSVSGGSVGKGYDHDGEINNKIYTLSSDGTSSGSISQSISNPTKGVYIMSAYSRCSNFFRNDGIEFYSYSLWATVYYNDGRSEAYYVSFSDGDHDWEYRETSFVVREGCSSISFCVFLRDPVRATANFDTISLVRGAGTTVTVQDMPVLDNHVNRNETEISRVNSQDGFGLSLGESEVLGVYLNGVDITGDVPTGTQTGFMVRDVADEENNVYSFGTSSKDGKNFNGCQDQIGLELDANYAEEINAIHVTGTIRDITGNHNGRAVELSYAVPLKATGWSFETDLQNKYTVNNAVYKHLGWINSNMSNVDWDSEAHSYYPAAALTCGSYGIGIASDMDFPLYWELEYNATTNQLVITYQLGITNEAPDAARFGFTLYKLDDPTWGFRSAMSKYTKVHPEYYTARATDHGAWVAWQNLSNVPDVEDFNIKFKETDSTTVSQFDADHNVGNYKYIEFGDWWLSNIASQTSEAVMNKVEALANGTEVDANNSLAAKEAQATEFCRALNYDGTMVCNYVDRAWAPNGAQIHINCNPFLPGRYNFFNLWYNKELTDTLFTTEHMTGATTFSGIYLDESSGWWVGNSNFNKAQYKYTTVPLTYSQNYNAPMLHRASNIWEAIKAMGDDLHARNKLVFANKCPDRNAFFTPLADILGNEQTVQDSNGNYAPLSTVMMSDWRALSYNKPFCLLLSNNWDKFDSATLERFFSRCMTYAIIPSPHDCYNGNQQPDSSLGQYFTSPNNYYGRDRAVWKQYMPVMKTISEAGWEAVTGATSNNSNVLVERYGTKAEDGATYIVVYNNSNSTQSATLTFGSSVLDGVSHATEMLYNNAQTINGNTITLNNMTADHSYVIKLY
ncbi:MAG: hypothetical protein IKI29_00300 [Clostridia bacterium]|nr:hypothetical protein [Clostridia bacterium]